MTTATDPGVSRAWDDLGNSAFVLTATPALVAARRRLVDPWRPDAQGPDLQPCEDSPAREHWVHQRHAKMTRPIFSATPPAVDLYQPRRGSLQYPYCRYCRLCSHRCHWFRCSIAGPAEKRHLPPQMRALDLMGALAALGQLAPGSTGCPTATERSPMGALQHGHKPRQHWDPRRTTRW